LKGINISAMKHAAASFSRARAANHLTRELKAFFFFMLTTDNVRLAEVLSDIFLQEFTGLSLI
jgi:hypothetical protein